MSEIQNLALSIEEAQRISGIGKTKLYSLLKSGAIPAKKLGKKTLILRSDLCNFLMTLERYPTKPEGGDHVG
jgi:excisionase family DNA binding protein